jgi:murein tripeptide amidase MpaA
VEVKDLTLQKTYHFSDRDNTVKQVAKGREETAAKIDRDDDKFFLSDQEITTYLEESLILKKDVTPEAKEEIMADFKLALQDKGKEVRDIYPSYEEVVNDLKSLEAKYPDLAKVVKLNDKPTADGRDIIALKISKGVQGDTSTKVGVIISGVHHAREWAGAVASQNTAHYLLENYATDEKVKRRVDNAEIWIVPLVNPDGYEYSRNEDRYWRKDREPFEKNGRITYGIDPNRNYWDGKKENYRL